MRLHSLLVKEHRIVSGSRDEAPPFASPANSPQSLLCRRYKFSLMDELEPELIQTQPYFRKVVAPDIERWHGIRSEFYIGFYADISVWKVWSVKLLKHLMASGILK